MRPCPSCEKKIAANAKTCPNCGWENTSMAPESVCMLWGAWTLFIIYLTLAHPDEIEFPLGYLVLGAIIVGSAYMTRFYFRVYKEWNEPDEND